jgi:hypothetical protein
MGITLSPGVLEQSFELLRRCGAGRTECVVVWIAPLTNPDHIDEVAHPRHTATPGSYDIDPAWVGKLWLDLARRNRTVRAQVHTHPGTAYHSSVDDHHALVHTPGYLSLVIPSFAQGPIGLRESYLVGRAEDGRWQRLDPYTTLEMSS